MGITLNDSVCHNTVPVMYPTVMVN